jgi:hypothetical protein
VLTAPGDDDDFGLAGQRHSRPKSLGRTAHLSRLAAAEIAEGIARLLR